jgi:hypothetical protein
MTADATIETSIGPSDVLHRLALAVECRDALTDRLAISPLRAGYELLRSPYVPVPDPTYPCIRLDVAGPARFKLRHDVPLPTRVRVRIDDPSRHFVPRRLRLLLWPVSQLDGSPAQPYIPTDYRLLRVWLWPGTAASFPVGSTVVRGRVMRNGQPARWARVTARGATNAVAGFAHADDRGEFALVVSDAGQHPLMSMIPLDLRVDARRVPRRVDQFDPLADITVEPVPRSSPPAPANLDTPRLRGIALPPGYVANAKAPTPVTVPTGVDTILPDDLEFGLTP